MRTPPGSENEDGFVLVSVLWALVLFAGFSALFVGTLGRHLQANAAFVRGATAEAAADGAIRLVAFRLAAGPSQAELQRDGSVSKCLLFERLSARIAVQDQDGLVDLNHAPLEMIATLLRARLDAAVASAAIENLRALRDRSTALTVVGTGFDSATAPAKVRLGSTEELHGLLSGARVEDIEAILSLVTVHSGSDGIDPAVAPENLLSILSGSVNGSALPAEWVRRSRGRSFSVIADVGARRGGRSIRRAVIEVIREPGRPFALRELGPVMFLPAGWPATGAGPEAGDTGGVTVPCGSL